MKKNQLLSIGAALALGPFLATVSHAQSIGIQIYENTSRGQNMILHGTGPDIGTVNLTAGVAGVAQNNWNSITGPTDSRSTPITASVLFDSTGAATGASVSMQGYIYGGGGGFDATDPNQIGDNSLAGNQLLSLFGTPASYLISGIPYAQYDVYVYLACDASGRVGTVSDGTTSYTYLSSRVGQNSTSTSQWTSNPNSTTLGSTYLVFHGETASSITISDVVVGNGGIGGIQIVAVPEPSTIGLLSLSLLGLSAFRPRFSALRKS